MVLLTLLAYAYPAFAAQSGQPQVKLVLQITIDGLRGDLINRYGRSFSDDGFNYLLANGVYFSNAHYQHANTETIVGHATLATGTFPRFHGMIGNVWFDRENLELSYNIEDAYQPLLPTKETETEGAQVDPAQKKSRTQGRSPTSLLVPTLADTLAAYYTGKSKIFGVSGKDRSAVVMAGKAGKAFWFSTNSGDFVTSSYYYSDYPEWVKTWNESGKAEAFGGTSWELANDISTYLLGEQDDRPYEADLKGYGRVFPHPYGIPHDPLFYTRILVGPEADRLTLDFAKALVINEGLGGDTVPDYLSISFSGVDAVNHFFGPSSLENEDIVVQLDGTLAELFSFIDQQVGLEHTLIALSADHGMPEMPEYATEIGYQAGRIDQKEIVGVANKVGERLGIEEVVKLFYRPYLYLSEESINASGSSVKDVRQAIADALTEMAGIARAVPVDALERGNLDKISRQIYNNQHHSRSGDIYVVQDPYWFLLESGPIAVMHGSPWGYDTHVPIIFLGPGIAKGQVDRLVHPADVAPTLATYLGLSPPAASVGEVLPELFEANRE